ncbi:aquaporin-1-like isoform X2 [Hydractinia symbiolongicarpus]|uniref:aquaporin-1-like isoform X2 n=1 Tax=Hydractinia symbiolongicarpus TaxID=13093 RepID=UPI0025501960|nr:aquaporin-1-like isoform X2 [Hydractinia symbiolongicarpus]
MADELGNKFFWRAVFAEFFATTMFVFLVTSVVDASARYGGLTQVALAIGLGASVLVQIVGPISGAHFNPAVTIGVFLNRGCSFWKLLFYIPAQFIGGIVGAAISYGLTPKDVRNFGKLGNLVKLEELSLAQGLFIEVFLTMLLVLTVLASTSSDNKRKEVGYANGLAIGVSITVAHLVGIYWFGPYIGGILSGLLYRFVFGVEDTNPSIQVQETNQYVNVAE